MTTRDEWLALAARLEAATGPDRELDAEIMFDLYATPCGVDQDGGPRGYLWPDDNPSWNFGIRFPGKNHTWFYQRRTTDNKETLLIERDGALVLMNDLRVPPLTASIDAAVSVVEREFPNEVVDLMRAALSMVARKNDMHIRLYAAKPYEIALALMAALCRAKAEAETQKETRSA